MSQKHMQDYINSIKIFDKKEGELLKDLQKCELKN